MRTKIKPPVETKAALIQQTVEMLERKYPLNPPAAIEYLLNFFTSADLVGIRDELRKGDR